MARKRGASILFINSQKQVLLFLRDSRPDIPFPGCWDILGGHVESDETPEECIRREMLEEIGIDIGEPMLFRENDMGHWTEYTFWKAADLDIAKIKLNEGQCLKWFTKDDVSELSDGELAFGFRRIVLDFYREKPFE